MACLKAYNTGVSTVQVSSLNSRTSTEAGGLSSGITPRGLRISPMLAFIRTAAHWDAVGGRGEVTDCDQNSVGFLHNVCLFIFVLKPKLISRSPSYI